MINQELETMDFQLIDPGLRIQYVPDQGGMDACLALGRKIGAAVVAAETGA